MAFCPVCNSPLAPGSRFCSNCGSPAPVEEPTPTQAPPAVRYCPSCGRQNTLDSQFCELCGTPLEPVPTPPAQQPTGTPGGAFSGGAHAPKKVPVPGGKKLPMNKLLLFGGIGVAVIIVIVVLILLLSGGGKGGGNTLFYLKDKEIYSAPLSGKDARQVTSSLVDSGASGVSFTPMVGERLAYFVFLGKDGKTLFYPDRISPSSEGINLYYRSMNAKKDTDGTKIDSDVTRYAVNDKTDTVTYLKDGGNLYQYSLRKDSKEKLSGSVTTFYVDDNGSRVVFRNDENTLYSMVVGKDKEKLDSDVTAINYVSDDCRTVVYMKDESLYRKVEGKDREKIASDVYTVLRVYDSGEIYYRQLDEDNNLVLSHMTDDGGSEFEWLREDLKDETLWTSLYTLCYFDGRQTTVLTENCVGWLYDYAMDTPAVVFSALDEDAFIAPRLSKQENYYGARTAVEEAIADSQAIYTAKGGKTTRLSGEFADLDVIWMSNSGKAAWFLADYEDDAGTLYRVEPGSAKAEKVDDDVYDIQVVNDQLTAYFKDYQSQDETATLCVDGKKLEDDVYTGFVRYNADAKRLLYYVDYDSDKSHGTLCQYSGGKSGTVADDVSFAYFAPDGSVLYLSDYSMTRYRGDLSRFDGSKSAKLDDDVSAVVPVSSRKYMYAYYDSSSPF